MHLLLIRTQVRPGRAVTQKQEDHATMYKATNHYFGLCTIFTWPSLVPSQVACTEAWGKGGWDQRWRAVRRGERGKSERERGVERYTNSDRRTRQAEGSGQTLLSAEDKVTPLLFFLIVIGLSSLAGLRTTGSVGYNDTAHSDKLVRVTYF